MAHYPRVRTHWACPLCGEGKLEGLLFCLPCGRASKRWLKDEWPEATLATLAATEFTLTPTESTSWLRRWF